MFRFSIIYSIFIVGFSQAYYIIFQSYNDPEENPLNTSVESVLRVTTDIILFLNEFLPLALLQMFFTFSLLKDFFTFSLVTDVFYL